MIKVYIASPYTKGDVAVNVRVQLEMANTLMDLGFAPFAPLYSHFQHMAFPRPYEDWIKIDLEWVKVCNCVLRLPGESAGADGEVFYAEQREIPVFYSLEELDKFYKDKKEQMRIDNKYDDFMIQYYNDHKYCPKCGSDEYSSTLMGYALDLDDKASYKDLNRCTCGQCKDIHTTHERVSIYARKIDKKYFGTFPITDK